MTDKLNDVEKIQLKYKRSRRIQKFNKTTKAL